MATLIRDLRCIEIEYARSTKMKKSPFKYFRINKKKMHIAIA
jgi:hypothetical protein